MSTQAQQLISMTASELMVKRGQTHNTERTASYADQQGLQEKYSHLSTQNQRRCGKYQIECVHCNAEALSSTLNKLRIQSYGGNQLLCSWQCRWVRPAKLCQGFGEQYRLAEHCSLQCPAGQLSCKLHTLYSTAALQGSLNCLKWVLPFRSMR